MYLRRSISQEQTTHLLRIINKTRNLVHIIRPTFLSLMKIQDHHWCSSIPKLFVGFSQILEARFYTNIMRENSTPFMEALLINWFYSVVPSSDHMIFQLIDKYCNLAVVVKTVMIKIGREIGSNDDHIQRINIALRALKPELNSYVPYARLFVAKISIFV